MAHEAPVAERAEQAGRDPDWLVRLARRGEVRMSWWQGPKALGRAAGLSFALGAWGIFTGYALFLLFVHELHSPWLFLAGLLLAAATAFLVEWVRERIGGGEPEPWSVGRIVFAVVMLAFVELFVVAVHSLVHVSEAARWVVGEALLGSVVATRVHPAVSLVVVAVLWMVVGACLALALLQAVPRPHGSAARGAISGAGTGLVVGLVVAPLAVLAAALLARLVGMVALAVGDPAAFWGHVEAVSDALPGLPRLLLLPVQGLHELWRAGSWGPWAVGLVLAAIAAIAAKAEGPRRWALGALAVIALPALLSDLGDLFAVVGLSALVWALPSAALGALAPSLRETEAGTRTWGFLAFAVAAVLAVLALANLASPWFLALAAAFVGIGVLLFRRASVGDLWPLVALTAALCATGAAWVRQQANFAGVFEKFHSAADANLLLVPRPKPGPFSLDPSLWSRLLKPNLPLSLGLPRVSLSDLLRERPLASEADRVTSLVADLRSRLLAAPPPRLAAVVPAWDALEKALSTSAAAPGTEGLAVTLARSARDDLAPRLRDLERVEEGRLDEAESLGAGADGLLELSPARALYARVRDTPWRTDEGRAAAEVRLRRIGSRLAALEEAQARRLSDAVDALEREDDEPARAAKAAALGKDIDTQAKAWSNDDGRKAVESIGARLEERRTQWREEARRSAARLLELCLAGSLGFWVSVGLLAGWALARGGPRTVRGSDGIVRCAWATSPALALWHDHEHGVRPRSDADLFRRMAIEILARGAPKGSTEAWEKRFHGFRPAAVSTLDLGFKAGAPVHERCDRRDKPAGARTVLASPEGATLVVENARRIAALSERLAKERGAVPAPDLAGSFVLDDLASRARDPEALVAYASQTFVWRKDTPVASFLQSVGVLPLAHAAACSSGGSHPIGV